jgi:hypothetical protein
MKSIELRSSGASMITCPFVIKKVFFIDAAATEPTIHDYLRL